MDERTHEIRNQLAAATAHVEAFLDGVLPPDREHLEKVMAALERIRVAIDDSAPDAP